MSPTIFKSAGLRFYFFSREEPRAHVHVQGDRGEAKIRIEPRVELAENHGLGRAALRTALGLAEERLSEIRAAWERHFGR